MSRYTIREAPLSSVPSLAHGQHGEENQDAVEIREYDVFISYASENRDEVVRPLAQALLDSGMSVWFDELELKIGDSLIEKIDRGLAASRFGIVMLSQAFFARAGQITNSMDS